MAQLNLYLDGHTDAQLTKASRRAKVSKSAYVRELVRRALDPAWPASVTSLAGAWRDSPTREALRAAGGDDVPREKL